MSGDSRLPSEIVASLPDWVSIRRAEAAPEWLFRNWTHKRCSSCGEMKPKTAFHVMRSMKDGRYPRCKECRRSR